MKEKLFVSSVVAIIISIIIWVTYTFYLAYRPKALVLQGQIDARQYTIASEVPGRVENLGVKKGQIIHKGDYVYSIDSPQLNAKVTQADAAKEAVTAIKDEVYQGTRKQEVQAAYQNYLSAKANKELLEKTYKRIKALYDEGVVQKQRLDELSAQYKVAEHTQKAAYETYAMAKEGAREETKKASKATEKVYEGKVQEVQAYVKETKQYSKYDGEVTQLLLHEGELAPQGFPVVMVTDLSDIWAKFHVREDLLHYFAKGSVHNIKIPALQNKTFAFQVTYVSVMGDYATWKAAQAGKGFDMKSFEIELRPTEPIEGLRVGMSTLITIDE